MRKFYFHIVSDGEVVLSTLPDEMYYVADLAEEGYRRYYSNTFGRELLEVKEILGRGYLYVCSGDRRLVKKILIHYLDALRELHISYKEYVSGVRDESMIDFRRLKHNIADYNARNKDEVENFLSLGSRQENTQEYVKDLVERHSQKAAIVLMKAYKNATLIDSEILVHDMMKADNPPLDIRPHEIHRVVKLSFQPYFIGFLEKKIHLTWNHCYDEVEIDYPTISVALGHIWSNAIKYARKGSEMRINFQKDDDSVEVCIGMESLYIEKDERIRLTEEGYSGKWAQQLRKDGNGIGMYYIQKLIAMNRGTFKIECGDEENYEGDVPYAWNTFILRLNRSAW